MMNTTSLFDRNTASMCDMGGFGLPQEIQAHGNHAPTACAAPQLQTNHSVRNAVEVNSHHIDIAMMNITA